ncbi:Proteasome subunit alpha type 5-1 family protein [Heracleum sosnowskyi]|uniref:Proteasome subunit alpha type 5-1 family protein n=1 Tax=Heracleum sosnowskyi TaxID=360622 RepID=A0AAD8MC83_9APIA|nr:Proteasome subunit alpha type 5-1 family protein [Heracleum sosnowskyi]KAK1367504.1 Proteasome subunit alpha type 5-1 family protein [Heracleum sosnowskyi]
MSSQKQLEKMQGRQGFRNEWHSDLMSAMTADAPYCCFAVCCPHCASYLLRKRALYDDMSRYECCGGYMPCSGRCGEKNCPEFCLCTEVFCCFSNSVASTRFLLQDQFAIQTTKCDNCIISFMLCLQQLACICSLVAMIVDMDEISEASQLLSCLSDWVYCTVCACMQTQHKIEMDKRDGQFGPQPMGVPPPQQMSRVV